MICITTTTICNNLHKIITMSFRYDIRICQWMWSVHLWEMADIVDGHIQAPGKHLKWDTLVRASYHVSGFSS